MRKVIIILIILFSGSALFAQNGWVRYYTGYPYVINDVFFINNQTGWTAGDEYILKTTNGGVNWQRQADTNSFPQNTNLNKIFFIDQNTGWVAGGAYTNFPFCIDISLLLKTTNGGATWFNQPAPSADYNILYNVYATDENNVFVCDYGTETFCIYSSGGVFKSSNSGYNWSYVSGPDNLFGFRNISFISQNTGWAIGYKRGDAGPSIENLIKTTNGGTSWELIRSDTSGNFLGASSFQFINSTTGYLDRYNKCLKSTNGGQDWFEFVPSLNDSLYKLYFINVNTGWSIANGNGNLIKRTTDGGSTWQNQYTQGNLFFNLVSIFFTDNLHGWVSSNNGYIYATGTGGVTSIEPISTEIPESYKLYQNYPNPFNPSTRIKFDIPKQGNVKLTIYDMSGKEVSVLVNSELKAGSYEYNFDGSGLSSGVYFYKLQSGDFIETRRMILLK